MGELADLFELMHGAPESFRTLRAVIHSWHDNNLSQEGWLREIRLADPDGWAAYAEATGREDVPGDEPDSESVTKLWIERGGRHREDCDRPARRTIWDGRTHFWYHEFIGVSESEEAPPLPQAELLDPLTLVPELQLEIVGEATVAGRSGIRLRALRTEGEGPQPNFTSMGRADEGELIVDRERGFLLRLEWLLDDRPLAITELTELELDGSIDRDIFRFVPPPGTSVSAPQEPIPEPRYAGNLTVEQARELVPFVFFVLPVVWPRASMTIQHMADGHFAERLIVGYSDSEEQTPWRHMSISQQATEPETHMPADAERIQVDGRAARIWLEEPGLSGGHVSAGTRIRLERDGTHMEVHASGLERDELLALVASLVPARTELPRLS